MDGGLLVGLGAALVVLLTLGGGRGRGSGSGAAPPAPPSGGGGAAATDGAHRAYVDALYAQQLEFGPNIQNDWGLTRLRAVTQAAASYLTALGYPVDPRHVWGLVYRESQWMPVGVYGVYGPPADWPARAPPEASYKSSAYGMSQTLRSRYEGAAPWHRAHLGGLGWWPHEALLWPRLTLWWVAGELARLAAHLGRLPTPYEVGQWWACPGRDCAGAEKKAASIEAVGGLVYETGPLPADVTSRQVPGPPVQPTDGIPPSEDDWWS